VKCGDYVVQDKSDPRPVALNSLCAKRRKQGLDAPPFRSRGNRLGEDGLKCPALRFVHEVTITRRASPSNHFVIAFEFREVREFQAHHTYFVTDPDLEPGLLPPSLLHPNPRLPHIKLHHVNRLDQITVAEREVKALQAFLLVAMSQDGVGNVRINPATHRISVPSSAGGREP